MVKATKAEGKVGGPLDPKGVKHLDLKADTQTNAAVVVKSNKRFQAILAKWLKDQTPKRINWKKVGVSPRNRGGAPPNLPYVLNSMCPNIETDGFEPQRAKAGYVVHREDPAMIKRLTAHNEELRKGSNLFPPMFSDLMDHECVGGNHLTLSIGIFDSGFTNPTTGAKFSPDPLDSDLTYACREGHLYFLLKEGIPDEDLVFLSEFFNVDQNQNQANSEIHLMQSCHKEAVPLMIKSPHISMGVLISAVTGSSMVKLRADHVGDVAHLVVGFGNSKYVEEIVWRHSQKVNPKDLTVSTKWLGDLSRAFGPDLSLLKMNTIFVHYDGDDVIKMTRPSPDVSRGIEATLFHALAKDVDKSNEINTFLVSNRKLLEPIFTGVVGVYRARALLHELETNVTRLAYGKSLHREFEHTVSGKYSAEKCNELQRRWLKSVEKRVEAIAGTAAANGLTIDEGEEGDKTKVGDEVLT